jgi:hypothetical protein
LAPPPDSALSFPRCRIRQRSAEENKPWMVLAFGALVPDGEWRFTGRRHRVTHDLFDRGKLLGEILSMRGPEHRRCAGLGTTAQAGHFSRTVPTQFRVGEGDLGSGVEHELARGHGSCHFLTSINMSGDDSNSVATRPAQSAVT